MPCLKYIVQNANQKELRMLRGKTIECISLIGLAVSKDKVSVFFDAQDSSIQIMTAILMNSSIRPQFYILDLFSFGTVMNCPLLQAWLAPAL
jgi:hypothetical protein